MQSGSDEILIVIYRVNANQIQSLKFSESLYPLHENIHALLCIYIYLLVHYIFLLTTVLAQNILYAKPFLRPAVYFPWTVQYLAGSCFY